MSDQLWRIVKHKKLGWTVDDYLVCPTCWPTNKQRYLDVPLGYKVEVKAVALPPAGKCFDCDRVADAEKVSA